MSYTHRHLHKELAARKAKCRGKKEQQTFSQVSPKTRCLAVDKASRVFPFCCHDDINYVWSIFFVIIPKWRWRTVSGAGEVKKRKKIYLLQKERPSEAGPLSHTQREPHRTPALWELFRCVCPRDIFVGLLLHSCPCALSINERKEIKIIVIIFSLSSRL